MSGRRIFIVENDQATALDLQHRLAHFGHQIVGNVTSGNEALKQIEDVKPDLVLSNVQLAGNIDGIELAETLHSQYNLPVIFIVSNHLDSQTLARITTNNSGGFILKPFVDEELLATIEIELYRHEHKVTFNQSRSEQQKLQLEVIGTVSHEIRTPLSITKEGISLVMDGLPGKINEKQSSILAAAKNNIDRVTRLIKELLDMSTLESGHVKLNKELLNIVEVVSSVMAWFERQAREQNIELKTDFSAKDIKLYADQDKVIEIFTNLISNALKFTEKGWIKISVKELKDCVKCSVADTGIGISENDLPRVFNKFEHFCRASRNGKKGTGLGLSIVKGLVDIHQGKIWAESKQDSGTKFTFTFPLTRTEDHSEKGLSKSIPQELSQAYKQMVH